MKTNLYAMLPSAAVDWERRKIEAAAKMPRAEISAEDKQAIADHFEINREFLWNYFGMMFNQRRPLAIENGVARIHVNDYLSSNTTFFDRCLGASDYADVARDIESVRVNPEVKCVLVEIDSGGGSAVGCMEVARRLASLPENISVYAHTNTMCCSAAYAIAAGASMIFATPSAFVGSIGTISSWMDFAEWMRDEGITPHIVTSEGADLKASMNSVRTPTPEEAQNVQDMVNEYGLQFREWINSRRTLPTDAFRGQAMSGRDCEMLGLVDDIMSRDDLLTWLTASIG